VVVDNLSNTSLDVLDGIQNYWSKACFEKIDLREKVQDFLKDIMTYQV
jgi:UDP-glucose 4-epimerase